MNECLGCQKKLQKTSSWLDFLGAQKELILCPQCELKVEYATAEFALYKYNDFMQEVLYALKFLKDVRMAKIFTRDLTKKIKTYTYDYLVPIPMHPKMEEIRTFAHLDAILNETNIDFIHILKKKDDETTE